MKSKLIIITLGFLLFAVFSCTKKNIRIEKYPSGKIHYKKYFTNDKQDSLEEYFENSQRLKMKITKISKDSQYIVHFDETGKDRIEGWALIKKGKTYRNGWWKQFLNGEKSKIEYVTVGDTTRTNQLYFYDSDGNIDFKFSHFYKFDLPDTIEFNKPYKFHIELKSPIQGAKESYVTVLKLSDEIIPDYLNFWKSKSTYDVKELSTNLWEISHTFRYKGNFTIRGFIYRAWLEFKDEGEKDSITEIDYRDITYIKKHIYIK